MKKNIVALAVYRTVKAANDDASQPGSASANSAPLHMPLSGRSGWDPFEVWRTRIHVTIVRGARGRR